MRVRILTPIADKYSRILKAGMIVTWEDEKDAKRLCAAGYVEPEPDYLLRCLKPYGLVSVTVGSDVPKGLVKQMRDAARRTEVTVGVQKKEKTKKKTEPETKE